MTKALKIGLMSYAAKTPISERIRISYQKEEKPAEAKDKWDNWVFSLNSSLSLRGEETYKYNYIRGSFNASRVTPDLKVSLYVSANQNTQDFKYDGETIKSINESFGLSGLITKSINDHWSYGGFIDSGSSSYENIKFGFTLQPAIEYNLFPYSQSTRRQLRFLYRIGFNRVNYREETIYNKMSETLWNQKLSVSLSLKEKWGSVSSTLTGSHYFHDISLYRLTLFNIINLRLLKGLNFFAFGGGSRIHDQLSLVKGELTFDEIILRRKQLKTGYEYFFSVGLSFTFGSIYTNVVNPRFGSKGYGGMSIIIN